MPSLDERVLPQRFEELRDWQNLDAVLVHPTETFVANDELAAQRNFLGESRTLNSRNVSASSRS